MPSISMLDSTRAYIEDLKKTGLYGWHFDTVVETLLLRGIREAIDKKHIAPRVFPDDGEDEELLGDDEKPIK